MDSQSLKWPVVFLPGKPPEAFMVPQQRQWAEVGELRVRGCPLGPPLDLGSCSITLWEEPDHIELKRLLPCSSFQTGIFMAQRDVGIVSLKNIREERLALASVMSLVCMRKEGTLISEVPLVFSLRWDSWELRIFLLQRLKSTLVSCEEECAPMRQDGWHFWLY